MNDIIPCSLPDTQTQRDEVWSQQLFEIWGWLYPVRTNFKTVDLCQPEFTLGRNVNCDFVLNSANMNPNTLKLISKLQFKIFREVNESSAIVYLQDFSYNGTFVNKIKVGKERKIIIDNDDEISIGHPNLKIFIFKSRSDIPNVPSEISSKYVVSKLLGIGAMGEVKLVINKRTYRKFAMKKILKYKMTDNQNKIMNEPNILKKLQHPCIIRMEEMIDTSVALYIILELMEGGELFDRITRNGKFSEFQAKLYFYQMVQAVHYLHDQGITHRDLKPENMLLASQDTITLLKINDFGLSKVHYLSNLRTVCGTAMYAAPEVICKRRETYTKKVDIWSLGVILYLLLSGVLPFCQNHSLHDQILKGQYSLDKCLFHNVHTTAIDLIKRMLTVDPEKRISIERVLEHEWMQDESVISIVTKLMKYQERETIVEVNKQNVESDSENFAVLSKKMKFD